MPVPPCAGDLFPHFGGKRDLFPRLFPRLPLVVNVAYWCSLWCLSLYAPMKKAPRW